MENSSQKLSWKTSESAICGFFSTRLANLGIRNDVRQQNFRTRASAKPLFDYTAANLETALKIGERMNNLEVQEFEGEN